MTGRSHQQLEIQGVRLEIRVIPGPVDRPALIFLHEGLGSVTLWRDFPDKLARRLGLRAILYSRRGYGASDPLEGPRKPDFMHREALDVLPELRRALNLDDAILVGHSDGASIALIHAAAGGADHEFGTRGVVLMAPHVFVEDICVTAIAKARKAYAETDLKARLARHHTHVDDAFYGWADVWLSPAFRDWSLLDEVRRLRAPALLIQGTDDAYGTLAQIERIAEGMLGSAQKVVLGGVGHSPFRDDEGAVLDAISGFVERLRLDPSA
jgi:pimeloyl-ACP methyl ester carboxylesterase